IYKRRPAYRLKRQHKQEVISDNLTKCVEERITPCIAFYRLDMDVDGADTHFSFLQDIYVCNPLKDAR
ncbi:unnamed protein product, partial [Acanthoscelides obtectus]